MPFSASLTPVDKINKIDFGNFSQSITSYLDLSIFTNLIEVTLRNPNLITFINGFNGLSVNLINSNGQSIAFVSGYSLDATINQKIIGTGSLKKIGTAKLSLKETNSYSGNTEIQDGVLEIQTGSLGSGNYSGNITNAGQLSIITPTQQTLAGIISGIGSLSSSGDVITTNDNTYTGATLTLAGGKITISRQTEGQLTSSSFSNAGIIQFSGSKNIIVATQISGSGQINIIGVATVKFNAANTNTGIINIASGIGSFAKLFSLYNGQTANWVKEKILVSSGAVFSINVGGVGEFALSDITNLLSLSSSISNNGLKAGSSIGFDTTNSSGGTFTVPNIILDSTGSGSGSLGVAKFGTNTLVLTGTSSFTGAVSIYSGTILIPTFNSENVNGPLGSGSLPIKIGISSASKLLYTGSTISTTKKLSCEAAGAEIEIQNSATDLTVLGTVSGTGSFTKLGTGNLRLEGVNTLSGIINVNSGILYAANSSALGPNSSNLFVASGASLIFVSGVTIDKPLFLNGSGINNFGALRSSSGSNFFTNVINIQSSARIGCDAGVLDISGNIIAGVQSLTLLSPLSGVINVSGIISGSNGVTLIMNSGQCTLSAMNTFTGGVIISAGTVNASKINNFGQTGSLGADSSLPIQLGDPTRAGTLNYTGVGESSNRTVRIGFNSSVPVAADIGSGVILSNGTGALTFTAPILNIQTNATTGVGANRTLTLGGTGDGIINSIIRDNIVTAPATGTAFISIVKSGAGKWTLNAANTFSGATTINAGYLLITNASALGAIAGATVVNSGGSLQIQGGIAFSAEPLTISGAGVAADGALANLSGTNSMSGAITMAADARINGIAGTLTISGAVNGATRTLTLGGAGALTLSGIITLTTGGIIYNGAGLLILSAANVYTGATVISSGAVRISNAAAIGTAGAITVASSGQLEISGAITFARAVAISGIGSTAEGSLMNRSGNNTFSGAITLDADSTIGSSVGIFTISGTITGATRNLIFTVATGADIIASNQIALTTGTLQKTGVGTLTLSGTTSIYTGTTSALQGILRITSFSSFGNSSEVIVGSGATLQIQPAVTGTLSKLTTISGDGVSNQGALNNTALSNTIGSGVLRVGSSTSNRIASAAALTLTINGITRNESILAGAAAPLTFGGAGIITLTGVISTTGTSGLSSLAKVDAGTLNLGTLAHVYNGSTTISAGTITRSVVAGAITATGTFTTVASLAVTFTGGVPAIGSTWKFFPADTTNTYSAVALTGATGRTGTYNKTTSTLTIS